MVVEPVIWPSRTRVLQLVAALSRDSDSLSWVKSYDSTSFESTEWDLDGMESIIGNRVECRQDTDATIFARLEAARAFVKAIDESPLPAPGA